jgi:hypothetical protein
LRPILGWHPLGANPKRESQEPLAPDLVRSFEVIVLAPSVDVGRIP